MVMGGEDGFYTPNSDGSLLITASAGRTFKLTGGVYGRPLSMYSQGYLSVYDGVDANANALMLEQNDRNNIKKFSSGENMFFRFWSSDLPNGEYSGPELTVDVLGPNDLYDVSVNSNGYGSMTTTESQYTAGTVVNLVAAPNEGYILDNVRYYSDYENIEVSGGKWYSDNKASFVMPPSEVFVTAVFKSLEDDFSLYMEQAGTNTYSIPSGISSFRIFAESGDKDTYLVLNAPEGKIFQVMNSGVNSDSIYVYDGEDANAALIKRGTVSEMGRIVGSSQSMTLHYKGNWALSGENGIRVFVLDPKEEHNIVVASSEGGSVSASVGSALINTTISLTVNPDEGYMLDYITVVDSNGLAVDVAGRTWYEGGNISFKMPGTKVDVTPVFVRVADGPSINMPKTGVVELVIPELVTKFHVYDDLGNGYGYSANCNGSLLLTAPDGKRLQVEGALRTPYNVASGKGSLYVYDGMNSSATRLLYKDGNTEIPRTLSSGENMYISFQTSANQSSGYEGLNLTVTVDDPNGPHEIAFGDVYNGTINSLLSEATPGTPVIITANPNEGYVLDRVTVLDFSGNEVEVDGGKWYSGNVASFTMPQTGVTVNASFANKEYGSFYIETTQSGTRSFTIPSGIKQFTYRVGESEDVLESDVVLTAPTGKVLLVTGDFRVRGDLDSLYIYDGEDADAAEILKVGASVGVGPLTSSGPSLFIHFKENAENHNPGWWNMWPLDLKVFAVDPNEKFAVDIDQDFAEGCLIGGNSELCNIDISLPSASLDETVSLTVSAPEGCVTNGVSVYGNALGDIDVAGGTWYTSNVATFKMPPENVRVSATFACDMTAEGGLNVAMPTKEPLRISVPNTVESFNVNASSWDNETFFGQPLVLTAPDGYLFELYGNYDGYEYGFLAYDGAVTDLTNKNFWDVSMQPVIGGVSSGQVVTIYHVPAEYAEGDINVKLIQNKEHNISPYDNNESTVTISPVSGSAYAGDTVRLIATPPEGYVLKAMHVGWLLGSVPQEIPVIGGTWYNNEAKFVMPFADVYYVPEFVKPGDVNYDIVLPKNGALNLEIPEGVSSLNIFVDADDNNKYYDNSDGTLTLTAPEGYVFNVFGEVYTNDAADSLTVFDGNSISAKKLLNVSEDDIDVYSSSRSITLRFKSNESGHNTGFALEVWVGSKSSTSAIALSEFDDGDWIFARIDGNYGGKDTVSVPDAVEVNAIEFVREFTPELPATVVLPFSLPEGASVNAKFYQLESVEQEGRSWVANMRKIGKNTTPKANTPYVIIPEDSELQFEFSGTATLKTEKIEMTWSSDGNWYFTGAYVYRPWVENDEVLGLAYAFAGSNEDEVATGDFGRMGEGSYIVPMRAYLSKANSSIMLDPSRFGRPQTLSDMSSTELPENIDVKFMDEDDKVMAIGRMNTVTGEFKIDRWYDLKGRSTNKMPTTKGAFYNKRVIVK